MTIGMEVLLSNMNGISSVFFFGISSASERLLISSCAYTGT